MKEGTKNASRKGIKELLWRLHIGTFWKPHFITSLWEVRG
jgi:hypothetical protein